MDAEALAQLWVSEHGFDKYGVGQWILDHAEGDQ